MQLPIGILIYWVSRKDEDNAMFLGIWYYKEIYVPHSIEDKKKSIHDLKTKRTTTLIVSGTYFQIMDLLSQCDKFQTDGEADFGLFEKFIDNFTSVPYNKPYMFDNIQTLKGTSLMLDTLVDVDETMEDIKSQISQGRGVTVNISENWSFSKDIQTAFKELYRF